MKTGWSAACFALVVGQLGALLGACHGDAEQNPDAGPVFGPGTGMLKRDGGWLLRTPELEVGAGEEHYLCMSLKAPEAVQLAGFRSVADPLVHHFQLSTTPLSSPDGITECDRFPADWLPLYTASTQQAELHAPEGAAFHLDAGDQLVLQIHVLNAKSEPVTAAMEIEMEASADADAEPVGIVGFGSANIRLPPGQRTTVESLCRLDQDADIFQIVPHMHALGRRMELALGPDPDELETVYVRDPFDVNDQYFDQVELHIDQGTYARVRCVYENMTEQLVTFGESSANEMCNLATFVVGQEGLSLCVLPIPEDLRVPPDPDAGTCMPATDGQGIGRLCFSGGHQCGEALHCSADVLDQPVGICVAVGCNADADCGDDTATCCAPGAAGVANVCVPEACRPDDCIPVDML